VSVEATTERVLRLLALLQRRPSWTAAELAAELGVTDRSVRRDVERLRALGYPVHATAGVGGGYQLGAGTRLPPLLLDDEEAIATAVSLRLVAGGHGRRGRRGGPGGAREARPGDAAPAAR
jgi:predicted DNA-binding transcriptional regulator YafY